jgi:hypothetical protein
MVETSSLLARSRRRRRRPRHARYADEAGEDLRRVA